MADQQMLNFSLVQITHVDQPRFRLLSLLANIYGIILAPHVESVCAKQ